MCLNVCVPEPSPKLEMSFLRPAALTADFGLSTEVVVQVLGPDALDREGLAAWGLDRWPALGS